MFILTRMEIELISPHAILSSNSIHLEKTTIVNLNHFNDARNYGINKKEYFKSIYDICLNNFLHLKQTQSAFNLPRDLEIIMKYCA